MTSKNLKVHTESILPIIKKFLYTERDIFIRELISNACDALEKVRILGKRGECAVDERDLKIEIRTGDKRLEISDNGIGMSAEEVEEYIAQIAFSGAKKFADTYQEGNGIIGHFGLGFYSAYMVAERVEIETLSYRKGEKAVHWECSGRAEYTIEEGAREKRGTSIVLHLSDSEFADEQKVRDCIRKYCGYVAVPLFLNDKAISPLQPIWKKSAAECSDRDYRLLYRELYPLESDPVFWVHLQVSYPFHLSGVLYFPQINQQIDWRQNSLRLFHNRIFVADSCKEIVPEYLSILRGVIDSQDIVLNVSRSHLQRDKTTRQLAGYIAKRLAEQLVNLHRDKRSRFIDIWPHLELIVKLGAMQDESFYEKVKEIIIWENLKGEWTNVEDYLVRNGGSNVYYTTTTVPLAAVYEEQGIEVIKAKAHLDPAVMSFLESKRASLRFQRIDGNDEALLDKGKEKTLLDAEGKSESTRIAELFREELVGEGIEIEAKSLASRDLPAMLVLEEESRRLRDYLHMARSERALPKTKRTLIVNTNSSLVQSIYQRRMSDPVLARILVKQVYGFTLLGQRELSEEQVGDLISKSFSTLDNLVSRSG